jgi:hypothetical protein
MHTAARSPGREPKHDAIEMAARSFGLRLKARSRRPSRAPVTEHQSSTYHRPLTIFYFNMAVVVTCFRKLEKIYTNLHAVPSLTGGHPAVTETHYRRVTR